MIGSGDYCDREALKRMMSDSWDGKAVPYSNKYEIEQAVMSNPLLLKLELPDKSILVQRCQQQSRLMSRSKSESSTLFIDDVSDSECELELTGCPLEWPMESKSFSLMESPPYEDASKNSESSVRDKLRALPADEARTVLNAVVSMLGVCGYATEIDPVWVACDGTDPQYTAFLGYHKGGGACSRAIVTCRGPIESKEDLPTYGCIQRKHFWGLSQSHSHTTMHVHAKYDVLQHYDPMMRVSSEEIMMLECSWNKATTLLQPPLADSTCNLTIQILPGNDRSPTRCIYKELSILKRLVDSLKTGEVIWAPDMSGPPFLEKVKNMLKGTRKGSFRGKSGTPFLDVGWNSSDFDLYIETVVVGKRQIVDFTDEMWNILSGCSSFQELKDGLTLVFRSVQAGESRPLIVHKNQTTVGNILRDMSQQLRPEPAMMGITPLRMLAELGLQKLQRDYLNIFVGLELASPDQLNPFFLSPGDLAVAVAELYKLQAVLDMVMLCKTYLHLPIHYLSGYTREALKYFSNADRGNYIHKFKFPVKVPVVRVVLENVSPMEWTASMKSRQGNYTAHTITHISTVPPFDHLISEKTFEAARHSREPDYYCTIISCTQDKLR
ncbi:protein zwilch homolog [Ornithodoros turicata]